MKTPLTLAALAFLPLVAPAAYGQAETAEEREARLRRIVDPTAASVAQEAASPQTPALSPAMSPEEELARTVSKLLTNKSNDSLKLLGAAAVPALMAEARSQTITVVATQSKYQQPLYYLSSIAPRDGLTLLTELAQTDPERFMILVRAKLTPLTKTSEWRDIPESATAEAQQLIDAVVQSDQISEDRKLRFASEGFARGVVSPSSRALLMQDLAAALQAGLSISELPQLVENANDLPTSVALAFMDGARDSHLERQLLKSPEGAVRAKAINALARSSNSNDDIRDLVLQNLDDEDKAVAVAVGRLVASYGTDLLDRFSAEELTRLVQLTDRASSTDSNLFSSLASAIIKSIASARDGESVSRLASVTFSLPLPKLHSYVVQRIAGSVPNSQVAQTLHSALFNTEYADRNELQSLFRDNRPPRDSAVRSEYLTAGYLLHDPSTAAGQLGHAVGDLQFVPKSLQPALLDWLGQTDPTWDEGVMYDIERWSSAGGAFRASAYEESKPWKQRAMAIVALYVSGEANGEDVAKCADILIAALPNVTKREQFLRMLSFRYDSTPLPHEWNETVARIYASKDVSSGAKEQLPISKTPTDPAVLQGMVDVAAEETGKQITSIRFQRLSGVAAQLAASGRLRIGSNLMENWLTHLEDPADLVTYAAGIQRMEEGYGLSLNRCRGYLLARLRSESSSRLIVSQILRIPGNDTAEELVDAAIAINDRTLTAIVSEQVNQQLELRKLKGRLKTESAIAGQASPLASVLDLLETGGPAARLEAIRAIQTLGAFDAIPVLIRVVDSGTDDEKALAKSVLSEMNASARAAFLRGESATDKGR